MNINELKEFMRKCKFELSGDITEDTTLGKLGLESLDIMMLTFELSNVIEKDLEFKPNNTIKDVLEIINHE